LAGWNALAVRAKRVGELIVLVLNDSSRILTLVGVYTELLQMSKELDSVGPCAVSLRFSS
jgi:hypothetical protein